MSSETSLTQVLKGCPARRARFITSTASGSCSSNFSSRSRRFRNTNTKGADPPATRPSSARSGLPVTETAATAAAAARTAASATRRCASIESPACSMTRPSASMCGLSSKRRARGDSSRRYFWRSSEEASRSASTASICSSLLRSSRRVRASDPKAGTINTCDSRNTAPPSNTKKTRVPPVIGNSLSPARGQREQRHRQVEAAPRQPLLERRHDARRPQLALDVSGGVDAAAFEREDLRHRDDVAFHAVDLLEADQSAAAVLVARDLDDDVDGRRHLRAQRLD